MATVGRNLAVADLKHMHLYGWLKHGWHGCLSI